MSVPKPRNSPMADRLQVGDRNDGGELAGGVCGGRVWTNAFNGSGVTVDVPADEAERFGRWLIRCARAARSQ
jgi:hypothetical protein